MQRFALGLWDGAPHESGDGDYVLYADARAVEEELAASRLREKMLADKWMKENLDLNAQLLTAKDDTKAWAVKHFEEMAEKDRDSLILREQIASLTASLDRIIGMCGDVDRCACGRPTGTPAIVACAKQALGKEQR